MLVQQDDWILALLFFLRVYGPRFRLINFDWFAEKYQHWIGVIRF